MEQLAKREIIDLARQRMTAGHTTEQHFLADYLAVRFDHVAELQPVRYVRNNCSTSRKVI